MATILFLWILNVFMMFGLACLLLYIWRIDRYEDETRQEEDT
jgi:hypothetical protein